MAELRLEPRGSGSCSPPPSHYAILPSLDIDNVIDHIDLVEGYTGKIRNTALYFSLAKELTQWGFGECMFPLHYRPGFCPGG